MEVILGTITQFVMLSLIGIFIFEFFSILNLSKLLLNNGKVIYRDVVNVKVKSTERKIDGSVKKTKSGGYFKLIDKRVVYFREKFRFYKLLQPFPLKGIIKINDNCIEIQIRLPIFNYFLLLFFICFILLPLSGGIVDSSIAAFGFVSLVIFFVIFAFSIFYAAMISARDRIKTIIPEIIEYLECSKSRL